MASSLTIEAQRHSNKILASPAVRRLIREHGLKPTEIEGTGPNRRVLKEDILKMIQTGMPGNLKSFQ
jgi:pyruvate/2-oxoglutarate dehydrogenase complex dihydrolipoamide acyltransferase (E2) component